MKRVATPWAEQGLKSLMCLDERDPMTNISDVRSYLIVESTEESLAVRTDSLILIYREDPSGCECKTSMCCFSQVEGRQCQLNRGRSAFCIYRKEYDFGDKKQK